MLAEIKTALDLNYWLDMHTHGNPRAQQKLWEHRRELEKRRDRIYWEIAEEIVNYIHKGETEQ